MERFKRFLDRALQLFERDCRESPRRLFRPGRHSQGDPPPEPGLYRLIRIDNGEPWYIGQTSNLAQRIPQHRDDFPDVEWIPVWKAIVPCFTKEAYGLLKEKERRQIKQYRPEGNRRAGGGGNPPHTERCERWRITQCKHLGECLRWGDR